MTNTRTQSNLRLLKSRNQREGWYCGKIKRTRTHEKVFSLSVRIKRNKAFWHLNDILRTAS